MVADELGKSADWIADQTRSFESLARGYLMTSGA
jgi:hypothetical protein